MYGDITTEHWVRYIQLSCVVQDTSRILSLVIIMLITLLHYLTVGQSSGTITTNKKLLLETCICSFT
jgi:hypothetical protein